MADESNSWLNTLNSAPIGPASTAPRAIALTTAALVGVVFLVVPSLQGVPWPNRIVPGFGGFALIAICLFGMRRGKPLLRGMRRDAERVGGVPLFAFSHVEVDAPGAGASYRGSGWVILRGHDLVISARTPMSPEQRQQECVIALAGIDQPSQREGDSTVFNRLEISEHGGVVRRFAVIPPNGSSVRGATTAEVASIVSRIERARSQSV